MGKIVQTGHFRQKWWNSSIISDMAVFDFFWGVGWGAGVFSWKTSLLNLILPKFFFKFHIGKWNWLWGAEFIFKKNRLNVSELKRLIRTNMADFLHLIGRGFLWLFVALFLIDKPTKFNVFKWNWLEFFIFYFFCVDLVCYWSYATMLLLIFLPALP